MGNGIATISPQGRSVPGLFQERVQQTPSAPAYHYFEYSEEHWHTLTWQKLEKSEDNLRSLKHIIIFDFPEDTISDTRIVSLTEWFTDQNETLSANFFDPYTLTTIVYTSCTTERPKGVMLRLCKME